MESFAAVVHALLKSIRKLQSAYPAGPRPPVTKLTGTGHRYRVRPTSWGLADGDAPTPYRPKPDPASTTPIIERRAASPRWRLELAAHGLPPARGLLSTW